MSLRPQAKLLSTKNRVYLNHIHHRLGIFASFSQNSLLENSKCKTTPLLPSIANYWLREQYSILLMFASVIGVAIRGYVGKGTRLSKNYRRNKQEVMYTLNILI